MLVYSFREIDSTQLFLKRLTKGIKPRLSYPIACLAKKQTRGYGRRGSRWESDVGGLYFSLFIPRICGNMQQRAAVAVAMCLDEQFSVDAQIKWPNDVFVLGRKLAGVIIEAGDNGLVIGIGMNVNNNLEKGLGAIALKDILGRGILVEGVFYSLLNYLLSPLPYDKILHIFRERLMGRGEIWEFLCPNGEVIKGRLDAIADSGAISISGRQFMSGRLIKRG